LDGFPYIVRDQDPSKATTTLHFFFLSTLAQLDDENKNLPSASRFGFIDILETLLDVISSLTQDFLREKS